MSDPEAVRALLDIWGDGFVSPVDELRHRVTHLRVFLRMDAKRLKPERADDYNALLADAHRAQIEVRQELSSEFTRAEIAVDAMIATLHALADLREARSDADAVYRARIAGEAWVWFAVMQYEPTVAIGAEYRERQREIGRRRWANRPPKTAVIADIARKVAGNDSWGDPIPAKELWSLLYSELDLSGLEPEETESDEVIEFNSYDENDEYLGRKKITMASWRSAVSNARKELR
ncbi:MAG: hypothetical protein KJZ83_23725, partial [Burkholderiaceae bacterium]|nr:hypothetical protein [Burkholderiaceae bacterium]